MPNAPDLMPGWGIWRRWDREVVFCSEELKMNTNDLFNAGPTSGIFPEGDHARQAVHSLRGYVYQALATALAWTHIGEHDKLFLEVAEDYAVIAKQALNAVQVKDTEGSGSVTLKSASVQKAVAAFVDLVEKNPGIPVYLRFLTTSEIGTEQDAADRPAGMAGLKYWKKVAAGENILPLRKILESDKFEEPVRAFCKARDNKTLCRELIQRIDWDCGKPGLSTLRQQLEARLLVVGRDRFSIPNEEAKRLANTVIYKVLQKSILNDAQNRVLTRADLYSTIETATRISLPRSDVDDILRLSSNLMKLFAEALDVGTLPVIAETGWLIDGSTLPSPQGMIARSAVESEMARTLIEVV